MSSETPPPAGTGEGASSSTTEGPPVAPEQQPDTAIVPALSAGRPPSITVPCVVDGMPDEDYHSDPVAAGSLSHSGLKTLITKSPAHLRADRERGRKGKYAFDVGHGAHTVVLGTGLPLHRLVNTDGRTKDGKAERAEVRARGAVALKPEDYDAVHEMADALRRHPVAGGIFQPERGHAERSAFWYDDRFGFWRRARFDFSTVLPDGRFALVDYKTTTSADPRKIERHVFDFGYYTQDPYYCDAAVALGIGGSGITLDDVAFVFVFQEKDYPYAVTVAEIDDEGREWGRRKMTAGLARYAECLALDEWPQYADRIVRVGLPRYASYALTDEWRSGALDVID